MRSHFLPKDLDADLDLGDGGFNFDPLLLSRFSSGPGGISHGTADSTPVAPTPPDESVQAMAAVSASGSGGPGSVVAETSTGGFTINLTFDAAAMAAPATFRTGIEQAAAILSESITDKITVNLNIDYSGTGGGAFAGPSSGQFVPYSTVSADLMANAAPGDATFNALPTGSKIQNQSEVAVWNAQLKAFGLLSPTNSAADGSASFATDISPNLLVGVALHELTHAIGRVPYGSQPDIFDFYRFTSSGTRLFTDNIPASASYFSLDGGATKLADIGVSSDPSDFLNSGVQGANDPFNEFYSGSTLQSLTTVDLKMLDALGFNFTPLGLTGNTAEALQGGAKVLLLGEPAAVNETGSTTLSSATIKIANGSSNPVSGDELYINGQQNGTVANGLASVSWNDTSKTLTLSGTASTLLYAGLLNQISFQDTGTDASNGSHPVRTVTWSINDGTTSYSATSQLTVDRAPTPANSTATDAAGATVTATAASGVLSHASDLDSDQLTVITVSDTAHGAGTVGSSIAGVYGHLTLNGDGSYSYVADNAAAIGSAATGSHLQDVFSYTISDGNGGTAAASLTVTLDRAPVVTASNVSLAAGTSVAASSLFSATDPDGNAITTYAFKDTGPGHFVLNGNLIEPNNQEIDVTAAQLSQLTYLSVQGSVDALQLRINDGTLWSNWTSFTVTPAQIIQIDGTTSLVQAGNNYFLDPAGGGTGPELSYGGSVVTAGEFGSWTPIGAVQLAGGGYNIAWHDTSSGMYTVWSVSSSGAYQSNVIGAVVGNSAALENLETLFNQDLNSDGTVGLSTVLVHNDGTTKFVEVGNNYFLDPAGGGTGPELSYGGSVVTAGEFGTWTPIGAVQLAGGGYDIAWHNTSSGMYTVWSVSSSGAYQSNVIGAVVGNSAALENLETLFNQDLNSDGIIGLSTVLVHNDGTTKFVELGNNYFLDPAGGGTGPELSYNGSVVTAGEFGSWTPIGAVQLAGGGYDIAWHDTSSGMYTVWSVSSSGAYQSNVIGAVVGNSAALENLETLFNQDLNSDGTIGVPAATQMASTANVQSNSVADNFQFASSSGPVIQSEAGGTTTQTGSIVSVSGTDVFVFAPHFGQVSIANFAPATDTIEISKTVFANLQALLTTTHDDTSGSAVITDAAHDTITLKGVTTAQLLVHQSDFHFI